MSGVIALALASLAPVPALGSAEHPRTSRWLASGVALAASLVFAARAWGVVEGWIVILVTLSASTSVVPFARAFAPRTSAALFIAIVVSCLGGGLR